MPVALSLIVGARVVAIRVASLRRAGRAQWPGGQAAPRGEWTAYGHDAVSAAVSRRSRRSRATTSGRLAVAWTYRTGDAAPTTRQPTKFEATPLVVDGTTVSLDAIRPRDRARPRDRERNAGPTTPRSIAAATGATSPIAASRRGSTPARRAGAPCRRRIYLGTIDARIIALDAKTGAVCRDFGDSGTVRLRRGLHNAPFYAEEYELTSPPAVIRGMIVTGSAVADNNRTNAASGEVRAYDARTGALRWSWDPVPRDSADPAWNALARHDRAHHRRRERVVGDRRRLGARSRVRSRRGARVRTTTAASASGDNRYANSIVALRASHGESRVALPDRAPRPLGLRQRVAARAGDHHARRQARGRRAPGDQDRPALRARPRHGKPVFPVEERPVPASTLLSASTRRRRSRSTR